MTQSVTRKMRFRVKHGIFVERQPDEVFAFVADVDNSPKWQSTLFDVNDRADVNNGQLQARARVRDARNVLGKKLDVEWQVIDFEPGKRMTMEVVKGAPVYWKMTFEVEPVDGGTYLTGEGGGDLGEIGIPPAAFSRSCQHLLENDLATLRDILEKTG